MELQDIREQLDGVYSELRPLDAKLPRSVEPIYLADPTLDPYLHDIALQKIEVRGRLTALLDQMNSA